MSFGQVIKTINGHSIDGLPVREHVARGRFLGKLAPGSVFKVLDCVQYKAGKGNPKAGGWFEIRAVINNTVQTGWIVARYVQKVDEKAYMAGLLHKIGFSAKDVCKSNLSMRNLMN